MFSRLFDQQTISSLSQAIQSVFPGGYSPGIKLTASQANMFPLLEMAQSLPGPVYSIEAFTCKVHQDFQAYEKAERTLSELITSMKMSVARELDRLKEHFFKSNGKLASLREAGMFFSDFKQGKFSMKAPEQTSEKNAKMMQPESMGSNKSKEIMSLIGSLNGSGKMEGSRDSRAATELNMKEKGSLVSENKGRNGEIQKEKLMFALTKLIQTYAINEKVLNSKLDFEELRNTMDQTQQKMSKLINGITPKLKDQRSFIEVPDKPVCKVNMPTRLSAVSLDEEGSICTKEGGLALRGDCLWVLNEHGSVAMFQFQGRGVSFEKIWQKKLPIGASSDECMIGLSSSGGKLFLSGFSNKLLFVLDSMSGSLTNSFPGPLSASQSANSYLSCAAFLNESSIIGVYSSEALSTLALFSTKSTGGSSGSQPSMMTTMPSLEGGVSCVSRGDSSTIFIGFVSGIIGMFSLTQQQFLWASDSLFSNSITSLRLSKEYFLLFLCSLSDQSSLCFMWLFILKFFSFE